jgi:hypothetical protein
LPKEDIITLLPQRWEERQIPAPAELIADGLCNRVSVKHQGQKMHKPCKPRLDWLEGELAESAVP